MSALDASQDREGHEIDSGGRSESDDEFDQDSVAIGNLAAAARAKLADQLLASGRADAAVEAAFRGVPRHTFLPEMDPVEAYQDRAVVIKSDSEGLPVSASTQPTMMAVMLSQLGLAAGHRVLEIGTGTGYNAALIARIVGDQKSVVTIDVVPDLIGQARVNLTAAGYGRVTVVCGDGAAGVPDHAPYDRIIVTTGTWDLATQWWAQLGPAGRIVLPLSIRGIQLSVGLETAGDHLVSRSACRCSFIRMAGDIGELADLDLWLTLAEPGLTRLNLMGRHEAHASPAQQRIANLMPLGGLAQVGSTGRLGVAAFIPGDQPAPYDITARGYGPSGPGLAKYLARQAIVWHELGRPGAQDLELSAWPPGARPETIGGASIVIDRPHVRLAVRWPTL